MVISAVAGSSPAVLLTLSEILKNFKPESWLVDKLFTAIITNMIRDFYEFLKGKVMLMVNKVDKKTFIKICLVVFTLIGLSSVGRAAVYFNI